MRQGEHRRKSGASRCGQQMAHEDAVTRDQMEDDRDVNDSRHFPRIGFRARTNFRIARNPSRIAGRRGDHFLEADLAGLIGKILSWIASESPTIRERVAGLYFIGREPLIRMSTSLLALSCQSGPVATLETPISARSRSNGSRSLRRSPLFMAVFTSALIAPLTGTREESYSLEGPPTTLFSAGAIMCFAAM